MKTLISQCNKVVKVPKAAADLINSKFKKKSLGLGAIIIPEQRTESEIYFLEKGLLRMGRFRRAHANTLRFIREGEFFWMPKKSEQCIQAMEAALVRVLPFRELKGILQAWPQFFAVLHTHMIAEIHEYWQRCYDRVELSPPARYQKFLARYPKFDKRVPIEYIAAYLGIVAGPLFAQSRASRRSLNAKPKVPKKVIFEK